MSKTKSRSNKKRPKKKFEPRKQPVSVIAEMAEDLNPVFSRWLEIKQIVDGMERDVTKNARGTTSAGIRLRRTLRFVRASLKEFIMYTLNRDKDTHERRITYRRSVRAREKQERAKLVEQCKLKKTIEFTDDMDMVNTKNEESNASS